MKYLAIAVSAIVLVSCGLEVKESRKDKNSGGKNADVAKTEQGASDSSNNSGSNKPADDKSKTDAAEQKTPKLPGCEVGAFNAKLNGVISKDIVEKTFIGNLNVQIRGEGALAIDNDPLRLKLNLAVTKLSTNPNLPLIEQEARKELNKAVGERILDVADKAQQDAIKAKQSVWSDYSCVVGMVKTYKFPVENGAFVTVEFDPALPFAAYPDKVNEKFSAAAVAGISFDGISGKVIDVKGNASAKVGEVVSGNVKVEKAGAGYRFNYNFGDFKSVAKIGLFTSIVYSYTANNVQSVSATIPIKEGKDSITVEFK
jgi:hypothetical protein